MRWTITDWTWIETLTAQFDLCGVEAGDHTVVLTVPAADPRLVDAARIAMHRLGAQVSVLTVGGSPADSLRSTILESDVVLAAADAAEFVVDLSRPGLDHDPELEFLLGRGGRILVIDIDDPMDLARDIPHAGLPRRVDRAVKRVHLGEQLAVASTSSTELDVDLEGAHSTGHTGVPAAEGSIARWPNGRISMNPAIDAISGTVVLMPGDLNLTTRAFVRSPVRLTIEQDNITAIDGDSSDADVIRATLESAGTDDAYRISEIGWGMVRPGRRDPELFDPSLLAHRYGHRLEGVVRLATGREPIIGRRSPGRLEIGVRSCSVNVDGVALISAGTLQGDLAPDVYEEAALEAVRRSRPDD